MSFAEACAVLDPFLANWFRLSRSDHFVSEIDPSAPVCFTFKLKWLKDFNHTHCLKCSRDWSLGG